MNMPDNHRWSGLLAIAAKLVLVATFLCLPPACEAANILIQFMVTLTVILTPPFIITIMILQKHVPRNDPTNGARSSLQLICRAGRRWFAVARATLCRCPCHARQFSACTRMGPPMSSRLRAATAAQLAFVPRQAHKRAWVKNRLPPSRDASETDAN